ncbi:MAG: C10 family peptidase [Bacteroidota bacterium]
MKQRIFTVLILTFYFLNGFGQSVSQEIAKKTAINHYYQHDNNEIKLSYEDIVVSDVFTVCEGSDTLYYIFNINDNKGFVIVSADERAFPILGYTFLGNYSTSDQPPAFGEWMESRKQEIIYIKSNNLSSDNTIVQEWKRLKCISSRKEVKGNPLLSTTWGQSCNYNEFCPFDSLGPCNHARTGCVATALAQILKYWSFPEHGIVSYTYNHQTYGTLTADFESTYYDWTNMINSYSGGGTNYQITAVSTLMYHIGVSVKMNYGPGESCASTSRIPASLRNYFNYSHNVEFIDKSSYTNIEWENIIKAEIDSMHPVFYVGGSSPGHAFVCDGYQGTNYFHFNWGWNGNYDGYFYLTQLNPGTYDYTLNQFAIIKIYPSTVATSINCTEAILNGNVFSENQNTNVSFEYDTSTNYGSSIVASQSPISETGNTRVSAYLTGLSPNTQYHYRTKYVNLSGTFYSGNSSFTTKGNWTFANKNVSTPFINSLFFTNDTTGYAVGFAEIIKTVNGGNSWIELQSGTSQPLYSVFFVNDNIGYSVGGSGTILKTINAGSTWILQTSGFTDIIYSVFFTDENTGFAIGSKETILKTSDGGNNWVVKQSTGTNDELYSVFFTDNLVGYASGSGGKLYKTIDGGDTWILQTLGAYFGFYSIYFSTPNIGYIVGGSGIIMKTTDAGNTWTTQISPVYMDLKSVCFSDPNNGYAVGFFGNIIKTNNGGSTWSIDQCECNSNHHLFSVVVRNPNLAYAVGTVVLKKEFCSITSNDDFLENSYCNVQKGISNPFPNPANQSTIIEFMLPADIEQGQIVFCNSNGKPTKQLLINNGMSSINIPTSEFSNGVYFYYIEANNYKSMVRKMIVIN